MVHNSCRYQSLHDHQTDLLHQTAELNNDIKQTLVWSVQNLLCEISVHLKDVFDV